MYERVIKQRKKDKNKIYSLHEPHVYCMSKGKLHKRYEFGTKASIAKTKDSNVIVGALAFLENRYDGHTLPDVLAQVKRFRKRAGIEGIIGHLKADHRLGRNFLSGFLGDEINLLMAAAAFNFRKWLLEFYFLLYFLLRRVKSCIELT